MIKEKKCKGHGKAKDFKGCGNLTKVEYLKYGLCQSCYSSWIISDDPMAQKTFKSFLINHKKKFEKEVRKKDKALKDEVKISDVMRLADTYFSRYIRLKNSLNGLCTCYTCGTIKDIKEVDNGHYIKREHKATRYNENNCKPQCKTCNGDTKHNGKQTEFRENLVNEYGIEAVESLEALGRTSIKANGLFYRNIANEYRQKVNDLQRELKVKYW
jgi:hypothetical protein